MTSTKDQTQEVRDNAEAFKGLIADLLAQNLRGQYALMRDGKIEEILRDFGDAVIMGERLFGDEPFSVQKITDRPVDLGVRSRLASQP